MIIFARIKPQKIKITSTEPIIVHPATTPRDLLVSCGCVLVLVIISAFVFKDHAHKAPKEQLTYQVCSEAPSMDYRDKTDGKIRTLNGYKYCETLPMQGTGNGYGSCENTGCNFAGSQEQTYKERKKEIGLIHFIR